MFRIPFELVKFTITSSGELNSLGNLVNSLVSSPLIITTINHCFLILVNAYT